MCDKCRVDQGLTALEAMANGEDVSEMPQPEGLPEGATPIPMIVAEMGDKVGIVTTRDGWIALKTLMSLMGGIRGDD